MKKRILTAPLLPYTLIALLFAVCAAYTLRFYHRMPLFEHQLLAPLLERMKQGQAVGLLEPGEMVIGGGHWYLTGNMLGLWLAHFTQWNLLADAVALLLAIAVSVLMLGMHVRTLDGTEESHAWLLLAGSALLLSLNKAVNLLWVNQVSQFLNVVFVLGCVILISRPRLSATAHLGIMALAVSSVYTLASGLALMMVLLAILCFRRESWKWQLAWLALFITCAVHYVLAFKAHSPVENPTLQATGFSLMTPVHLVHFILNGLGAPFMRFAEDLAPVWGITGLAWCGMCLWLCLKHFPKDRRWLGGVVLVGSALGYLVIASLGRYGFGPGQGLNSRNITQSSLFWLGTLLLTYHVFPCVSARRWLWGFALISTVCLVINSVQLAIKEVRMGERYAAVTRHVEATWPHIDPQIMAPICYNGFDAQIKRLQDMAALKYNIFDPEQ